MRSGQENEKWVKASPPAKPEGSISARMKLRFMFDYVFKVSNHAFSGTNLLSIVRGVFRGLALLPEYWVLISTLLFA